VENTNGDVWSGYFSTKPKVKEELRELSRKVHFYDKYFGMAILQK
jgi:hypothetical protein